MKRFLILFSFLTTLCLSAHSQAGVPGWVFQWWDCCGSNTSVVSAVNWNNVGTGSNYRNYLHGYVKWPGTAGASKTINFQIGYDDGHALKANGVTVASGPCCGWNYGSYTANAGDIVKLEFWSDNYGGGPYSGFVMWDPQGDGSYELVTSSSIATTADYWAPPPPPTPIYGPSGITQQQQTRKTSNLSQNPNGHNVAAEVTGDDNVVTIQQIGGAGHYVNVDLSGNVNTINILQTTTDVVTRHYMEATIVNGNNNNLILQQRDTAKTQFVSVDGSNNAITTNQKGLGNHYLDLKVTGNNHSAGVIQDGSGNHRATVELSGTQPWNFNLNQSGSTNKTYTLPHNMSDGSVTSGACYTVGGCSLTINQQ